MKLSDPLKIAYRSLVTAKLRFLLTVLGIVIGVASVILVQAIGASAQALIVAQVEGVGSDLVAILPGASEEDGPPAQAFGVVTTTLRNDDLDALRERGAVPYLTTVAGYVTGSAPIESRSESMETSFQGVSSSVLEIENMGIAAGRFFFPDEEEDLSRSVVLGATRAEELFPNSDPIGEMVKIRDIPFRVIGVLEERGSAAFSNPDTLVYVPLLTAQKLLLGIDYLNFIRGKVDGSEHIDPVKVDTETLLRDRHDIEEGEESDFSVRSTDAAIKTLTTVTDVLKYFLSSIAGISLLVGGIGIMNSMLISVSQRIREIGLRKAVGARPSHIVAQFLIESAFITFAGGAIGLVFGVLVAFLASVIIGALGYDWKFIVPPEAIALSLSVSIIIGFLFGIYPAIKASRVSPMEALRYE